MKKIKNTITLLTIAAMLFLLPESSCLKASADEPVTYVVKYLPGENGWRYQDNRSVFDESGSVISWELYQLREVLKAGDTVVVYNDTENAPDLDLGSTRFANLTISSKAFSIIHTGGVQDCFVMNNSFCAVNGDVTNAHVYENSVVNYNGNVQELQIHCGDKITSSVGVGGTVGHLYAYSDSQAQTFFDLYNFQAGSLLIDQEGKLTTPDWSYSKAPASQPVQPTPQPEVQQQPEAQQPAQQVPASGGNDDEYDAVPKTGESNLIVWLLCIGGLCLCGSIALKRAGRG